MKVNKFQKYLEYEILQIDKRIEAILNNKETIRAKAEKAITKQSKTPIAVLKLNFLCPFEFPLLNNQNPNN